MDNAAELLDLLVGQVHVLGDVADGHEGPLVVLGSRDGRCATSSTGGG